MLNHITIMGRLTKDPELRRTNSGKAVTSFTVACDRDMDRGVADFFDCVAWSGTAEFVSKYFTKGQLCVVEGRMQFRDWTDKNGNNRRSAELVVNNIYFASKREDNNNSFVAPKEPANNYAVINDDDGELPF